MVSFAEDMVESEQTGVDESQRVVRYDPSEAVRGWLDCTICQPLQPFGTLTHAEDAQNATESKAVSKVTAKSKQADLGRALPGQGSVLGPIMTREALTLKVYDSGAISTPTWSQAIALTLAHLTQPPSIQRAQRRQRSELETAFRY